MFLSLVQNVFLVLDVSVLELKTISLVHSPGGEEGREYREESIKRLAAIVCKLCVSKWGGEGVLLPIVFPV